jgi:hypothetical protein
VPQPTEQARLVPSSAPIVSPADAGAAPRAATDAAAAPSPSTISLGLDAWKDIRFVDVPDAFGAHTVLRSELLHQPAGLRLVLIAQGPTTDVLHGVTARVHVATAAPVTAPPDAISGVIGGGMQRGPRRMWTASFTIPWQGAPLDEAFVEVDIGAAHYWLEVPYGFIAGPSATAHASDPRTTPKRGPAMAKLGPHDAWVPFRDVTYDLGVIQNGWRLSARLANPFDAHAELELYRDDTVIGQSAFLWDVREPRTNVSIAEASGATLEALPMQVRLHEDGMRRSDDFHFNRSGPCQRGIGMFRATVGEVTVTVPIPSSLYGYTHGTADPYDAHRVANAEQVLGEGLF